MRPYSLITILVLAGSGAASTVHAAPEPITHQIGVASFYGGYFHGRRTANGERFDQEAATAAHRTLPFGTRVLVTNLDNGKSFLLRINDRGPFAPRRIIDVSRGAADALGFFRKGLARVKLEIMHAYADMKSVPPIDVSNADPVAVVPDSVLVQQ